ncbi:MAG: amino acid ABC transporter ATP-binding protein [Actinobacteria bacterium]|nr:amino acid ABC transporter ATP-binding protein [Actinomycetota bacterium]
MSAAITMIQATTVTFAHAATRRTRGRSGGAASMARQGTSGRSAVSLNRDVDATRRKLGIVFQGFNLFPHLTVVENVALAPRVALGLTPAAATRRAKDLLKSLGLAEKAREYPDRLSGGQQQRVAIARALATEPKVLLLDEITSALDPVLVAEVLETLRSLAASGMTMLIATHEMAFAADVADRICYLEDGRLIEEGTPKRIFGSPRDRRTKEFLRRVRSISGGRRAPGR